MALLRVSFVETYNREKIFEEAGFFETKPRTCNCDKVPYQHTHDSYYYDWSIEVENEYYTFEEE